MIGQVIIANALPVLSLLFINITQPQITPSATIGRPQLPLAAKQEIVWRVKKNETLSGIAKIYYGNEDYWVAIVNDNPWISDPNILDTDWNLKLRPLPFKLSDSELTKLDEKYSPQEAPIIASAQDSINITAQTVTPPPPSDFDEVYKDAGAKFGVPWQILYGIHLTETGLRDGIIYNGGGSGARGPMQFMPGTFQAYAVDGDGDGKASIDDAKDSIYTAANYLAQHGSIYNGLVSYGGNINGTLNAARERGLHM